MTACLSELGAGTAAPTAQDLEPAPPTRPSSRPRNARSIGASRPTASCGACGRSLRRPARRRRSAAPRSRSSGLEVRPALPGGEPGGRPEPGTLAVAADGTPTVHAHDGCRTGSALLEVAPGRAGSHVRRRLGARGAPRARGTAHVKQTARTVALEAIRRVTDEGGYSKIVVPGALGRSRLDERDRAFATELAFGTIRRLPADRLGARPASRAVRSARMSPERSHRAAAGRVPGAVHRHPAARRGGRDRRARARP